MSLTTKYIVSIQLVLLFAFYAVSSFYHQSPDLQWTMVNVNQDTQGDAHVIQVKTGKTVLIDTGVSFEAKKKLLPFFAQRRINHLDAIFITHPHTDHYDGIRAIISAGITVGQVFFNIPDKAICDKEIPWGCKYDDVLAVHQLLKDNNIEIKVAKAGQSFNLGNNVIITILYAFDGISTPVGRTDVNDLSLIMMLQYANWKFLFTGDLNKKIGSHLAALSKSINADIIKVPHHGTESLAPDIFFEKVAAKHALVPSPGKLWCSPRSARTRNWFNTHNIPVWVNGFHGNVFVTIRNKRMAIRSENFLAKLCQ